MAKTDAKGNWIDATGAIVPRKYVKPLDRARDAMVEKLFKEARAQRKRLEQLRRLIDDEIESFLDKGAAEVGMIRNEGGNYTFTGFSGDKKVQLKVVNFIDFDERLQLAKQLIDQCLVRWAEGADDKLKLVVFDAFKTDQKGRVDTKRILGLRRLNIKDAEWKKAMDLITEAVTVVASKAYILFQTRSTPDAEWQTIRLDLASV